MNAISDRALLKLCGWLWAGGALSAWPLAQLYGLPGLLLGLLAPPIILALTLLVGASDWLPLPVIVFLLASLTVPAYQEYRVRQQIAAGVLPHAERITSAMDQYVRVNKRYPATLAELALPAERPPALLSRASLGPGDGKLVVELSGDGLEGKRIIFAPSQDAGGRLRWKCASEELGWRALPQQCRD